MFVSGVEAICEAQRGVALLYFEDGSVEGRMSADQSSAAHHGPMGGMRAGK